jgi:hypothetical protein
MDCDGEIYELYQIQKDRLWLNADETDQLQKHQLSP